MKKTTKKETTKKEAKKAGAEKAPAKKAKDQIVEDNKKVEKPEPVLEDAVKEADTTPEDSKAKDTDTTPEVPKVKTSDRPVFEFEGQKYRFTKVAPKKILLNGQARSHEEIVSDKMLLITVLFSFLKKRFIKKVK